MQSPFYYPLTLHNGASAGTTYASWVDKLPLLNANANQVAVLADSEGDTLSGMYVWNGRTWQFVLPYPRIAEAIINGDVLDIYYAVTSTVTPVDGSQIWRNGLLTESTVVSPGGGAAWATLRSEEGIKSVNDVLPDGTGNVSLAIADIPNLQQEIDAAGKVKSVNDVQPDSNGNIELQIVKTVNSQAPDANGNVDVSAGGGGTVKSVNHTLPDANGDVELTIPGGTVKSVNGTAPDGNGNVSLTIPPAYTLPTATTTQLGGVKASSTVTVAGDGTMSVDFPVDSVSGQTGNVVIKATDANTASGTTLVADDGSTTGNIKLKRLVQGSNVTITPDGNGNLVIASTGGGGSTGLTAVQSEGTGTSLVDNDGTTGGIAILRSLAAGSGVTITPSGDNKTLTLTATSSYSLPVATSTVLGGVKVGTGVKVAGDGTLTSLGSVTSVGSGTSLVVDNGSTSNAATIRSLVAGTNVSFATDTNTLTISSTGGIADAPNDGTLYGRKNQAWAAVPAGVPEAPNDGSLYGRKSQGWVVVPAGISEAPTDGTLYGRKNSSWIAVPAALQDAPTDGLLYGRQSGQWIEVPGASNAITSVTNQAGTGAVYLSLDNPPAHTVALKSLVQGNNITLTEADGLITITASIPGGTVATVNSKTPDVNGNVALTSADVGALPLTGGIMQGAIDMANSFKVANLPMPTNSGDAVPLNYLTNLTIDGGTYA